MLEGAKGLYRRFFVNCSIFDQNGVSLGIYLDGRGFERFGGFSFESFGARHREKCLEERWTALRIEQGEGDKPPGCASLIAAFGFAFDPPFQKLSRRFLSAGDSANVSLGLEPLLLSLRWLHADAREDLLGRLGDEWSMPQG